MIYSDVERMGYFKTINRKQKYNITDVKKLLNNSKELTESQAIFIIKCVAIYNDSEMSNTLYDYSTVKAEAKRMIA